jgi:actin-related protein 8
MENKSSETIVIQLGSSTLRVGFGNQMQPFTIPNVIAYKVAHSVISALASQQNPTCDAETLFKAYSMVQNYLQSTGFLKTQMPKIVLPNKKKSKKQQEEDDGEAEVSLIQLTEYTDTSHHPPYLVGEEAFNVHPNDHYVKHWPIFRGHFNITAAQTFRTVVSDLERILEYTAIRILKIPREMFQQFSVVLIIPDAFFKDQVKALVDIVLRSLGFRSVFLQQESVSALFGAGVPSACVVDIGATHVNVVCVEEGVILPKTHLRQYYAGRDIDLLLLRILTPSESESADQLRMVEAIKKESCRLMQQEGSIEYICKTRDSSMKVSSSNPALAVAAHSLFHTSLLEISSGSPKFNQVLHPVFSVDTDDYLDDLIESKIEVPPHPTAEKKIMSLDQLIIKSILALDTSEIKKKLANCILLTGGGGMFSDLVDVLEDRLINRFPEEGGVDRVDVKASIIHSDSDGNKEHIRPDHLMWVGGTVIPYLESAKELWIARARWVGEWQPTEAKEELMANFVNFENHYQLSEMCKKWRRDRPLEGGVRLIREKATFIW